MLHLTVLNGLLRQELLDLFIWDSEELQRRLNDTVAQEGEVNKQGETDNLEPLESLPAQAKGDHPDEQGSASVDGRSRSSADASCNGQAKEVEATSSSVSVWLSKSDRQDTHPMLIMIRKLEMRTCLFSVIWRQPSTMSKYPYLPASVEPMVACRTSIARRVTLKPKMPS